MTVAAWLLMPTTRAAVYAVTVAATSASVSGLRRVTSGRATNSPASSTVVPSGSGTPATVSATAAVGMVRMRAMVARMVPTVSVRDTDTVMLPCTGAPLPLPLAPAPTTFMTSAQEGGMRTRGGWEADTAVSAGRTAAQAAYSGGSRAARPAAASVM